MINRLAKLYISTFFFIFYKCARVILFILKKKPKGILVILTYHTITKDNQRLFLRQIDELIRKSIPVFADFQGPMTCGAYYVAVTFDDGFQSVIENALPELQRRKIPATLFIPTGYLGKHPTWINNQSNQYINELVMTSKHIKNLSKESIIIGSHSVNHPNLTSISVKDLNRELIESKNKLEEILNKRIELLAYPYGEYNQKVLEISKQAGYKRVFSNVPLFPATKIEGFILGRISVEPDDWFIEYRLKLMGAYQWLPIAVNMKRRLNNIKRILKARRSN